MNDTTDSTEPMPMVPDADGYEQRVDDGRDETLLMHKGAELEAEMAAKGQLPFSVTNANDYMTKFKFDKRARNVDMILVCSMPSATAPAPYRCASKVLRAVR